MAVNDMAEFLGELQLLARFWILAAVQRQCDHAGYSVERRTYFMAHVGQEFAFETHRLLGLVLGLAQLPVHQASLYNFLLQVALFGQLRIAPSDFIHHGVKGAGQNAHFIPRLDWYSLTEIVRFGHLLRGPGDGQDGTRHVVLQNGYQDGGHQELEHHDQSGAPEILVQNGRYRWQIRGQLYGTDALTGGRDGPRNYYGLGDPSDAVLAPWGAPSAWFATKGREARSLSGIKNRLPDTAVAAQGGQNFGGGFGVVEGHRRSHLIAHYAGQRSDLHGGLFPKALQIPICKRGRGDDRGQQAADAGNRDQLAPQ